MLNLSKQNFRTAVENFDNIQRISRNEDPRKYWKNNTLHGELSEIANILFAVPVNFDEVFAWLIFPINKTEFKNFENHK